MSEHDEPEPRVTDGSDPPARRAAARIEPQPDRCGRGPDPSESRVADERPAGERIRSTGWPAARSRPSVIEDIPADGAASSTCAARSTFPTATRCSKAPRSGHRRVGRRRRLALQRRADEPLLRRRSTRSRRRVSRRRGHGLPVPGAFELPLAAMALAKTRRYACVVALGAIVRGETPALRLRRGRGRLGPPAGGDRDRRSGRVRRAHRRHGRAGRGEDRPGRRRRPHRARDGRPVRAARASARTSTATLPPVCRRSAQSAGRSPGSGTTAPTRWSRPSAASTRTCSGSGCSSTARRSARTSAPAASRAAESPKRV